MFVELPQTLILASAGAFLIGWILSSINSTLRARHRTRKRDKRDDRIRSLEAELRIAQSEATRLQATLEDKEKRLVEAQDGAQKRDNVISHQQERIEALKKNLRDSVLKTRELRAELTDRAAENVKSEAKLRQVETELSVAQASTDMLATGVLDYSPGDDRESDHWESGDRESNNLESKNRESDDRTLNSPELGEFVK